MTTPSLDTYCFSPQATLQKGDHGPTVEALCKLLALSNRGFSASDLRTGNTFTATVQRVVRTFQKQTFIHPDGLVSPLTWQILCVNEPIHMPTIRLGNHGIASYEAQTCLRTLGFYKGYIDSYFGPRTHFALIDFQSTFGIVGDGILDTLTWDKLGRALSVPLVNA